MSTHYANIRTECGASLEVRTFAGGQERGRMISLITEYRKDFYNFTLEQAKDLRAALDRAIEGRG